MSDVFKNVDDACDYVSTTFWNGGTMCPHITQEYNYRFCSLEGIREQVQISNPPIALVYFYDSLVKVENGIKSLTFAVRNIHVKC